MHDTSLHTILSSSTHPVGAHYVAQLPDFSVVVGRNLDTAKTFPNAEQAGEGYIELARAGDASAWNICYALEDLKGKNQVRA